MQYSYKEWNESSDLATIQNMDQNKFIQLRGSRERETDLKWFPDKATEESAVTIRQQFVNLYKKRLLDWRYNGKFEQDTMEKLMFISRVQGKLKLWTKPQRIWYKTCYSGTSVPVICELIVRTMLIITRKEVDGQLPIFRDDAWTRQLWRV